MEKSIKILVTIFILVGLPALAGLGVLLLWNNIIPAVCGFTEITYLQALGLFILGQILSSGFIIALFIVFGSFHAIIHNHKDWRNQWLEKTDEERREFILRRRGYFGYRNDSNSGNNKEEDV